MKHLDWDEAKNRKLMAERGVSFEQCAVRIESGQVLVVRKNKSPYEHQQVYVIEIDAYVYLIPSVEDEEKIFLKTIIPSRKATKEFLKQ